MKYIKWIVVILVILAVGYGITLLIKAKDSNQQVQDNGQEKYEIATFERLSSERSLKFSSYQDAKKYFETKAGVKNIKNIEVRWQDTPVMFARLNIDEKNNHCKYGSLNLITGEFSNLESECRPVSNF